MIIFMFCKNLRKNMFDSYKVLIAGGALIGLSYIYDILSNKLRAPSVLFLILTGIALRYIGEFAKIDVMNEFFSALELLGIIGLMMIVLEAAVDLHITKAKFPIIKRSFLMAIILLIISSLSIALAIMIFTGEGFVNSFVYAIPMSVVSSAVLIPSVHTLSENKKEFLIYESTFSDILGIMFFNFVIIQSGNIFSFAGVLNIALTIVVSIVLSYFLVVFFCKIRTKIKLFLMISILAILYAVGKKLHMSSLLIIFIFGLVLNNKEMFFRWRLAKFIEFDVVGKVCDDFRIITAETAFIVRTFFFVAFGMAIDVTLFLNYKVWAVGTIIIILLYLVRYINFKVFVKTNVFPEIFLAPRGLITILLFFSIPAQFAIQDFSVGILSFVILGTGFIMMLALIFSPSINAGQSEIIEYGVSPVLFRVDETPQGPYCKLDDKDDVRKLKTSAAIENIKRSND